MTNTSQRYGYFVAVMGLLTGYIFGLGLTMFRWQWSSESWKNVAMQTLIVAFVPTMFALVMGWTVKYWTNHAIAARLRDRMLWGVIGAIIVWYARNTNETAIWMIILLSAVLCIWYGVRTNRFIFIMMVYRALLFGLFLIEPIESSQGNRLFAGDWSSYLVKLMLVALFCAFLIAAVVTDPQRNDQTPAVIRTIPPWIYGLISLVVVASSGWIVTVHGLQNCQWLDRALERSGCYAEIPYERGRGGSYHRVVANADGTAIYLSGFNDILKIDLQSRTSTVIYTQPDLRRTESARYPIVSPDNQHLAFVLATLDPDTTNIILASPQDGTIQRTILVTQELNFDRVRFSLDSTRILADNGGKNTDFAWNVADGRSLGFIPDDQKLQYQPLVDEIQTATTRRSVYFRDFEGLIKAYDRINTTESQSLITMTSDPNLLFYSMGNVTISPQGTFMTLPYEVNLRQYDPQGEWNKPLHKYSSVDVWNVADLSLRQQIPVQKYIQHAIASETLNSVVVVTPYEVQLYRLK